MKYATSEHTPTRQPKRNTRLESTDGQHAISMAPPAYGLDFVDQGPAIDLPVQRIAAPQKGKRPGERIGVSGVQPPNETGLPDRLKAGIEDLSGRSMDDVKVHYHSSKPAQLQALAYTHGTEIHVGPRQEHHLPHEAWHVVQQKQGRVKQTLQAKGLAINDDAGLEHEAEVMGTTALQMSRRAPVSTGATAQAMTAVKRDGDTRDASEVPDAITRPSGENEGLNVPSCISGQGIVQAYIETGGMDPKGKVHVSDDMTVAVGAMTKDNKLLYAKDGKDDLVDKSNQILSTVGSQIELVWTQTKRDVLKYAEMDNKGIDSVLTKVEAINLGNETQGDTMKLYHDCMLSSAHVMGAGAYKTEGPARVAKYKGLDDEATKTTQGLKGRGQASHTPAMQAGILVHFLEAYTKHESIKDNDPDTKRVKKILTKINKNATKSRTRDTWLARYGEEALKYIYSGLSKKSDMTLLDFMLIMAADQVGINEYAQPSVGEGYMINSDYTGRKGGGKKPTYKFHWAGVVMESKDKADKVTLEQSSAGKGDPYMENPGWSFKMYGTKQKAQTFHGRELKKGHYGPRPVTMVVTTGVKQGGVKAAPVQAGPSAKVVPSGVKPGSVNAAPVKASPSAKVIDFDSMDVDEILAAVGATGWGSSAGMVEDIIGRLYSMIGTIGLFDLIYMVGAIVRDTNEVLNAIAMQDPSIWDDNAEQRTVLRRRMERLVPNFQDQYTAPAPSNRSGPFAPPPQTSALSAPPVQDVVSPEPASTVAATPDSQQAQPKINYRYTTHVPSDISEVEFHQSQQAVHGAMPGQDVAAPVSARPVAELPVIPQERPKKKFTSGELAPDVAEGKVYGAYGAEEYTIKRHVKFDYELGTIYTAAGKEYYRMWFSAQASDTYIGAYIETDKVK